jgi:hypothetical protein
VCARAGPHRCAPRHSFSLAGKDIRMAQNVHKSVDILLSVPEELKERMVYTFTWT